MTDLEGPRTAAQSLADKAFWDPLAKRPAVFLQDALDALAAIPSEPGLGEAWAAAEAALPEGWRLTLGAMFNSDKYEAWAGPASVAGGRSSGPQATPAAALLALAARLSEPVEP